MCVPDDIYRASQPCSLKALFGTYNVKHGIMVISNVCLVYLTCSLFGQHIISDCLEWNVS